MSNFFKKAYMTVLPVIVSAFLTVSSLFISTVPPKKIEIPDTPGQRLVTDMKVGWNLGCSLESFYYDEHGMHTETMWGNPKTTQEMIDMLRDAGFKTIRIPITWYPHMGGYPDYIIEEEWMARVQEIVNYVYKYTDMYAIINVQNDNHDWLIPDDEHWDATIYKYIKIWEQVAERFKNYEHRLLFESTNEPRVVGSALEWNGGFKRERENVNRLNAVFVDTIRKSGGKNTDRYLMLPTHAASHVWTTLKDFELPDDDRLIVSIHSYYPYKFTSGLEMDSTEWGGRWDEYDLEHMLSTIYKYFVKKGIPVYMDEFGCADKNNLDDRVRWTEFYVRTAKKYGISCNWWDNGIFDINNQSFGLLDRRAMKWVYPEIVDAIMRGADS